PQNIASGSKMLYMRNTGRFEVVVSGAPEPVVQLLRIITHEFTSQQGRVYIENTNRPPGEQGPVLRFLLTNGPEIGRMSVVALPGGRSLLHQFELQAQQDPEGAHFGQLLDYIIQRFQSYGLLSRRTKFSC